MMKHQNMVKGVFLPGMEESSSHDYLADDRTARLMHGVGIWVLNQHPTLSSSLSFSCFFWLGLTNGWGASTVLSPYTSGTAAASSTGSWLDLVGGYWAGEREGDDDRPPPPPAERKTISTHSSYWGERFDFSFFGFPVSCVSLFLAYVTIYSLVWGVVVV